MIAADAEPSELIIRSIVGFILAMVYFSLLLRYQESLAKCFAILIIGAVLIIFVN